MKKLYYSTFVPGLEEAVTSLLRHEGGVTVERVMNGGVLYRSVREPEFAYMHHTFLVLTQFQNVKTLDDAVKRLMTQGEWLDRMPYETLDGKKFRIVTMNDGQLEGVNMRYINMLEKVIMDHTGMRTLREKPEVELWIDRHTQGGTMFLWRIGARRGVKAAAPGLLRADLCAILASMCRVGGKNAVNTRIENALKGYGETSRIEGATRYYTSVNIAKTFFDNPYMVVLAYGENFPDGLSAGPLAYSVGAPLILTKNGKQAPAVQYAAGTDIEFGLVLGGPGLIPDKVANAITKAS